MPYFLLEHRHTAAECAAAFAAWTGFQSPLRHRPAASTCLAGGHALWWRVQADNAAARWDAPALRRATHGPIEVRDVDIP